MTFVTNALYKFRSGDPKYLIYLGDHFYQEDKAPDFLGEYQRIPGLYHTFLVVTNGVHLIQFTGSITNLIDIVSDEIR